MFDKVYAHTSFIGKTGYNNHARDFFNSLNKVIPVKIRNFSVGDTWRGISDEPHNNEPYFTDVNKEMLTIQSLIQGPKNRCLKDCYIYGGKEEDTKNAVNIVLQEIKNIACATAHI